MSADPLQSTSSSTGLSPRLGAVLAYVGWCVTGFLLWFVERRDPFVRFHAAQSIVVFGALALLLASLGAAVFASLLMRPEAAPVFLWTLGFTWVAALVVWAFAIWQVARGRAWRVPLASALADRLTTKRA